MKLSRLCVGLTSLALALILVSGPGTRWAVFGFRTGLSLFAVGLLLAASSLVLAGFALLVPRLRSGASATLSLALAANLAILAGPAAVASQAAGLPMIHDITTDTEHPPAFSAVVPLRQKAGALNPPEYAGATLAEQQRRAYPDLSPVDSALDPAEAFPRALAAARALGWEIVDASPGEGRIEATATTPWFGFKDDIVVRVAPGGPGSRIDVRSKSRVGRSDLGANAARIRAYLAALRDRGV